MDMKNMNQLVNMSLLEDDEKCYSRTIASLNKAKNKGELELAEKELQKLEKKYQECVDIKINIGKILLQKRDYNGAIKQFEEIISEKNKDLKSCTGKTWNEIRAISFKSIGASHFFQKNYLDAEKNYKQALDEIKANPDLLKKHEGDYSGNLAAAFDKLGKKREAIDLIERVVKLMPEDGYWRYNLAESYYNRGLLEKAKESYQDAFYIFDKKFQNESDEGKKTSLERIKAKILIDIGRVELIEGSYDSAEASLKMAVDIYNSKAFSLEKLPPIDRSNENENVNSLHNNLGLLYLKRESFDEAKSEFLHALKAKPSSAQTYNNFANVYATQNNKDVAKLLYKIALKLNPELKSAKKNISILNNTQAMSWWNWWFSSGISKGFVGILVIISLFALIASILGLPWIGDHSHENISSTIVMSSISVPLETSLNKTKIDKIETTQSKVNITNTTSVETTRATPTSTKMITETTSKKREPASPEIKFLFAALLIFLLIHPQVKGFSAGTIKFDLVLLTEIKGSTLEHDFESESEDALIITEYEK
jgi:tetratricopeptide (TPR) repeat protein